MTKRDQWLDAAISTAIKEPKARTALSKCMKRGRDLRAVRLATLPEGTDFRHDVKAIKERCIARQDELLERFVANAEKRGAKVFLAKDGQAAIDYCVELAREHGYETVAKSKSLTTEEIEINDDLIEAGLRVTETDLGELIIQLVGEKPYHLVFPSVHKMTGDVAQIFSQATGNVIDPDIDEIMKVVRAYLRPIFLNTDIGMTGANIGIAENGATVIETNEGNGRLVSSIGKCHICIMGIEKIVETVEDALMMVLAHPVSASGQLPTTYVSWMAGRNSLGDDGVPRESHIIILDNGRRKMRQDPAMHEALHCIRCGACMNVCPTYGVVGGHTFSYIYPGPIGIPWTAEVHGLEKAGNFADLCISCGLCKEICPADIDMPMMIAEVKHRDQKKHPAPTVVAVLKNAETMARAGCATAPLSNWALRNKPFRWLLEKSIGIEQQREMPPFARRTFQQQWQEKENSLATKRVVYFHDLYVNYNAPALGLRAMARLEELGCEVLVPRDQRGSGYPHIGYGDLDAARDAALHNLRVLTPYVDRGYLVVTTEPTAAYALAHSYVKLLPHHPSAKRVASAVREYFELLIAIEGEHAPPQNKHARKRFGFHCSCHQRPLDMGRGAMEWLRRQGAEVEFIETGTCCGMGGTFGLKHGPLGYELANAVGEPLFNAFKDAGVDAIITESSVCGIHLAEGTNIPVYHPLELL